MADVHLVCEGPADGLDVRVLDAVVAQILSVPVLISAAGGDSSLGSVAAWLEEKSRRQLSDGSLSRPTASALCIQDRNYRPRTEAQVGWNRSDAKRLIWLRHEIENYLLEPLVVLATFDSFRRTVIAPWAHALPTDAPAVTGLLASLAQPQLEDHVGQLVLAELWAAKGAAGETNFNLSRPLPSSGAVHPGRSEWLSALTQEVARLKGDFIAIGNLKILEALEIQARYDALLAALQAAAFISSGAYLSDIGGTELLGALHAHLHTAGAARLSREDLENELVEALARTYRPNSVFYPDEFQMLAERLTRFGARVTP